MEIDAMASARKSSDITFYGAGWCPDSRRSRALLDRLGVPYDSIDLDQDETASAWAAAQNEGQRRIPTIAVGAVGLVLIEPDDHDLEAVVRR